MKTTKEISDLLHLAAAAGSKAVRIDRDLGRDPEHVLRSCRETITTALRALNEHIDSGPRRISSEMLGPHC